MIKVLLASHGNFSEGTKSFLSLMIGQRENLFTLVAFLDTDSVQKKVQAVMQEIGDFDQLFIFCDIHGGSVEQELFRYTASDHRNIQIVSGYNLAVVMEILMRTEPLSQDEIACIVEDARNSLIYLNGTILDDANADLF